MSADQPKTYFQDNRWVERPVISSVRVCGCGTKYIKTRRGQKVCIWCMKRARA